MAGDWIKMEISTPDKPEVWAIAQNLGIDPDAVIGKLFRVWSWFDQQTETGNAPSVSKMLLDRDVAVTGFCDAMCKVGWMIEEGNGISLPNFDHHNGKTAKNRAITAKRVAKHKAKTNDAVTHTPLPEALPKEEKRREERNIPPNPPSVGTDAKPVKPRKRQIPDDWKPNAKAFEIGAREGYSEAGVREIAEGFINSAKAKATVYVDWDAAFYNWLKSDYTRRDMAGRKQVEKPARFNAEEVKRQVQSERGKSINMPDIPKFLNRADQ